MNLLGMKRKLLPFSGPMGGGGKGGGGGSAPPPPASQTVTQTAIPEYARPYVESMLGKSEALTDINQNPYQSYGGQRIAGFNPTQERAFQNVQNMQTAPQVGMGSEFAAASGMGALATQPRSAMLGQEALNYGAAGQMYGGMGAQQALARAQQTGSQAGMYGGMGAGYGAQAAGMAPTAQRFGQESADIGMAGLGYGQLGTGYGGRGAMAAEQGFGAGEQFARQATDPRSVQAYMSPYMQNVVDVQKQEALRDFGKGLTAQNLGAARQGTYGGARNILANTEAQRNLQTQLGNIQAAGTQQAFQDAQRQQQFGANLGLQGLQAGYGGLGLGMQGAGMGLQGLGTALQGQQARMASLGQAGQFLGQGMQGAGLGLQGVGAQQAAGQLGLQGTAQGMQGAQAGLSGVGQAIGAGQYGLAGLGTGLQAAGTLGQLGQTQFGQQQAINAAQQQVGAIQQAQAQQALDLGYQDFLKQRNYPYQQLAFQSDMLRGIPLSQSAQQIYTAPPSAASQLGGLGMSALGIYGMSGGFRAKGGAIKEMAEGGLAYAKGGDIKTMSTEQLTEMLDNPSINPLQRDLIEQQLMLRRRMEMNPETDQIMSQALRSGIGSIATGDMVPEDMAGGGIVAFAKGGDPSGVDAIKSAAESRQSYRDQLEREVLESMKRLKTEDPFKESRAQDEQIRAQMAESKRVAPYEALTMAGLRTMAGTSPYALANLGGGGEEGLKTYARSARDQSDLQKQLLQQGVEREKAQFGRQTQLLGAQQTALGQLYGKEAEIERAKAARANAGALQAGTLYNQLSSQYMTAVSREMETLRKRYKDQFNMDKTETELESEAVANVTKRLPPQARKTLFGDQVIPDGTPAPAVPAPAPAAGAKTFNVVVNGKTFSFPTKEAADTFKKRAKESDPKATIQ